MQSLAASVRYLVTQLLLTFLKKNSVTVIKSVSFLSQTFGQIILFTTYNQNFQSWMYVILSHKADSQIVIK